MDDSSSAGSTRSARRATSRHRPRRKISRSAPWPRSPRGRGRRKGRDQFAADVGSIPARVLGEKFDVGLLPPGFGGCGGAQAAADRHAHDWCTYQVEDYDDDEEDEEDEERLNGKIERPPCFHDHPAIGRLGIIEAAFCGDASCRRSLPGSTSILDCALCAQSGLD